MPSSFFPTYLADGCDFSMTYSDGNAHGPALGFSCTQRYGVQSAVNFEDGKGDVLKKFVASAKKWGINVCYYINPMTDGFLTQLEGVDEEEYMRRQKGMLTELLHEGSPYGPVNRLWFDGIIPSVRYYAFIGLRKGSRAHSHLFCCFIYSVIISPVVCVCVCVCVFVRVRVWVGGYMLFRDL